MKRFGYIGQPVLRTKGFTITELMIVLVLASILIAIGVPAFNDLVRRNRMTSEFNRLLGDITFARSEAIKRGTSISICPSTDFSTCSGTDWDGGWILFSDDGAGNPGDADDRDRATNEELIRVSSPASGSVDIKTTNFTDSGGVLFNGDGKMESAVTTDIGEFILCDEAEEDGAKGLTFSPFGQARPMRDTDSNGVVDYVNDSGNTINVSCP